MKVVRIVLLAVVFLAPGMAGAGPDADETERFVRARVEIAEFMNDFMKEQGGMERFRPGPDRHSMEAVQRMVQEINEEVAQILGRHGLTIDSYREQGPPIFQDQNRLDALFQTHPDLRARFEAIPDEPMGFMRGRDR